MAKKKPSYSKRKATPAECRLGAEWGKEENGVGLAQRFEQEIGTVEFVDVTGGGEEPWLNTANEAVFRVKERTFDDMVNLLHGTHQLRPDLYQYKWDGDDVIVRMGWE